MGFSRTSTWKEDYDRQTAVNSEKMLAESLKQWRQFATYLIKHVNRTNGVYTQMVTATQTELVPLPEELPPRPALPPPQSYPTPKGLATPAPTPLRQPPTTPRSTTAQQTPMRDL